MLLIAGITVNYIIIVVNLGPYSGNVTSYDMISNTIWAILKKLSNNSKEIRKNNSDFVSVKLKAAPWDDINFRF